MMNDVRVPEHEYTIELRFYGINLDPALVSARLNISPSNVFDGKADSSRTKTPLPFWGYNGNDNVMFQERWASLQDGFDFLLPELRSKKTEIVKLSQEFEGIWWCGHFQSRFDGGPTLTPQILAEIASYGVPLFLDNYFGG